MKPANSQSSQSGQELANVRMENYQDNHQKCHTIITGVAHPHSTPPYHHPPLVTNMWIVLFLNDNYF